MPRGSQPKYLAIYADLRSRILDGRLAPSERLPSQQELAADYEVTLMTLRQAVAELEAEGLIWVSRGRGSFVVDQPLKYRIGNLTSFAQQVTGQGLELHTRVLSIGPPQSESDAALAALKLTGTALTEIARLRLVGGRSVVHQRTVLASTIADELPLDQLDETSLYEMIVAATGYRVERATESLRAVVLGDAEAGVLSLEVGAPAMLSIRTSFSADDTPFLYDRALLVGDAASVVADRRADRLELTYNVTR
ncbi:MAG: GntR family transcriptional regulator [Acidimicrobiales bacterium]|jgi:GntR family transcriptional regulator